MAVTGGAALHSLAEEMTEAFMGEVSTMTKSERIIELAGAQWLGVDRNLKPHVMFRDPVTGSTCALPEDGISVAKVLGKLAAKRAEFGVRR